MTEDEFEAAMRRVGFAPTKTHRGLVRRWDHDSGETRWIMDAKYIAPNVRLMQLRAVERSIGLIADLPD